MRATTSTPESAQESAFALARRQFVLGALTVAIVAGALAMIAAAFAGFENGGLRQLVPGANPSDEETSIVVVGYGQASAPAETATLQILVSRADFYAGVGTRTSPDDAPGESEWEAAELIVAAVRGSGETSAEIEVVISPALAANPWSMGGPGSLRLDIVVHEPSLEQLNSLIETVGQAVVEEALMLQQVGVRYGVEECGPLERRAREAATEDARRRAADQAGVLGASLGALLEVSDVPEAGLPPASTSEWVGGAVSGCAVPARTDSVRGAGAISVTLPAYDPTGPVEATAYAEVRLTFAVEQSSS